jgi:hypothetical protein
MLYRDKRYIMENLSNLPLLSEEDEKKWKGRLLRGLFGTCPSPGHKGNNG